MTYADVWMALESESPGHTEVRRRIHPESSADLWLVIYRPVGTRVLRISVGDGDVELTQLPSGSGIELGLRPSSEGGTVLEVSLINTAYSDLFDALVADVVSAAAGASSPAKVAGLVAARIRRWQAFLRESFEGLSRERQRGLYGELFVLSEVSEVVGPDSAVMAWVGPDGAPQDFALAAIAIEVKTSAGKNPQSVRISSERQLDDSLIGQLFLWHLSVDERSGQGTTLPAAVQGLRLQFAGTGVEPQFEDTLLSSGYHDVHAGHYVTGYSLRASDLYLVSSSFPRLIESDCPPGLGDVHYSLELGALSAYRTEPQYLRQTLSEGAEDG